MSENMEKLVEKIKKSNEFTDFEKKMLISGMNMMEEGMVNNIRRLKERPAKFDWIGIENSMPDIT